MAAVYGGAHGRISTAETNGFCLKVTNNIEIIALTFSDSSFKALNEPYEFILYAHTKTENYKAFQARSAAMSKPA